MSPRFRDGGRLASAGFAVMLLIAGNFPAFTQTFGPLSALNTNAASDTGDDFFPVLTTDGTGNWVAVWRSDDSPGGTIGFDNDILVARSTDAGATWSAPAALNTNAASDTGGDIRPQVTTDGVGNWVAVWHSPDSLGGTIGMDSDILVARSTDAGATWSAQAALNTNAAGDAGGDIRPQVTTDGTGNWVAVWASSNSLGDTIDVDFDILVARSFDAGATWSTPVALNTNATGDTGFDTFPQVTTSGAGNWVAVWYSNNSLGGTIGTDLDIFFATGAGPDTDGDGLSDAAEVNVHGTDPLDPDTDDDSVLDSLDNCPNTPNASQRDLDLNGEGDACDINDGLILFIDLNVAVQTWQHETIFDTFNLYRGPVDLLQASVPTIYTHPPSTRRADRICRLSAAMATDGFIPKIGEAVYYLVTGVAGIEFDLGENSSGIPRPNDNPCP